MERVLDRDAIILQNAQSSGNGLAYDLRAEWRESSVYIIWSTGITAGQVVVETADDPAYTGTWVLLGTFNAAADKQDLVQVGGSIRAVRARISTAIVGGTVTARLYAN